MPEPLARGGEEFLLRVRGESMINAGILDGDFVVVRRQQDAGTARSSPRSRARTRPPTRRRSSGSTARTAAIRLQPENDALEPMYPPYVQVLGKVVGVFRMVS